jgi:LmbE family N-acetylglucosaminyl deacetylase
MISLQLPAGKDRLSILCLGAHSDDIEIGAGATLLQWFASGRHFDVRWCVLSARGEREGEARRSASDFLSGVKGARVEIGGFRDGFFPADSESIKTWFEALKEDCAPDVILTHTRGDAHQDHREVCRHTWNTFRDHLVLEYEIPKWDGDMGRPNFYVPVSANALERKIALLLKHFGTQRSKHWFDRETFQGLARLRGMECRAPERYAEAFFANKVVLV